MKKTLLLASVLVTTAGALAQTASEPLILNPFYVHKMSPDGRWLYSNCGMGQIVIYDLSDHSSNAFTEAGLGLGNCLNSVGTAVGNSEGYGCLIQGDKVIIPSTVEDFWYSSFHSITNDGSRIAGLVGNPGSSGSAMDESNQMYLPIVLDVKSDGTFGEPIMLPHPQKDFMGLTPQYCSATWISDDGKTVLGQMIDYSGMSLQPIVYREVADGEWEYSLPSEPYYNPDHIKLPPYPGDFKLTEPDPMDYMSEAMQQEYEEDMLWWETEGGFDPDTYPGENLEHYMTSEELNTYRRALMEYVNAAYEYNDKIREFLDARNAIFDSSPHFLQNGSTMNAEGTYAALTGKYDISMGEDGVKTCYSTYFLDLTDDSLTEVRSANTDIMVTQVIDGNIVLGTTPGVIPNTSYVFLPGASDFIPTEDFLAERDPEAVKWMEANLVHDITAADDPGIAMLPAEGYMFSGNGVASRDFSVFAAAVDAYVFSTEDVYFTYVFSGLLSDVKEVAESAASAVRVLAGGLLSVSGEVTDLAVTDLSGRKVFGMAKASGEVATGLGNGIYVVTYRDAEGRPAALKVAF
ncbi:MAG: hypothetical protein K2F87_01635 [Muribaculaceae bacterium]|nr:hypothetical protein [Muribaculaceae bacterium]